MYLLIWIAGLLFFGIAALLAKTEQAPQSSSARTEPKPDPSISRIFDDKPIQKIAIGILVIFGAVLALLFVRAYFFGAAP